MSDLLHRENMGLRYMIVACVILHLQNTGGNFLNQLFIDSQGLIGIDDFSMLCIKDVPYILKNHNLVPYQ